jgi:succinyl-CoA synthetase beta subunit
LFKSFQLPIPPGRICKTPEEAFRAATKIMNEGAEKSSFTDVVVKA